MSTEKKLRRIDGIPESTIRTKEKREAMARLGVFKRSFWLPMIFYKEFLALSKKITDEYINTGTATLSFDAPTTAQTTGKEFEYHPDDYLDLLRYSEILADNRKQREHDARVLARKQSERLGRRCYEIS